MHTVQQARTRAVAEALSDEEQDAATDAVIQRWLPATTTAPPPRTRGLSTVFDLVKPHPADLVLCRRFAQQADRDAPRFTVVRRESGAVQVVGGQYPDNRWTEERAAQEVARRARQRPPKPTFKAKTRGKKVRAWDGEGGFDS